MSNFKNYLTTGNLSSRILIKEAQKRGYKVDIVSSTDNMVRYSKGKVSILGIRSILPLNSQIASKITSVKNLTVKVLENANLPVPKQAVCKELPDIVEFTKKISGPYVLKPQDQSGGRGVYTNISGLVKLKQIARRLLKEYGDIIIEQYILGSDYRLLVVDGKFVSAVYRIPANVRGDGKHNIKKLISMENTNPLRSSADNNKLRTIVIDKSTIEFLKSSNLTLNSVPKYGEIVFLKQVCNQSQGGEIIIVTEKIHRDYQRLAEKVAQTIGLRFCGVDVITQTIDQPISNGNGKVIEVNSGPSLMIHQKPSRGSGDNVVSVVWDAIEKYCF